MRVYTKAHKFYCGIDLHARTMYGCLLNQAGDSLLHREMKASPEPFLQAIAPAREAIVVAVECILTWSWLADLCAPHGVPFVLGHARYMKAIPGGTAKNDRLDARKIAVLLRGGMLPQASGYPAERRATRDRLRRRMHFMRKRAELWTHVPQTNSQSNVPAIGKKRAYKTPRTGVAARFPDPAVQKSIEVALTLVGHDDHLLRDVELSGLKPAKPHDANTLYRLRTVPGSGEILRLVWLYEIHDRQRFPRVQDFVSSCRLVKCAKESAGTYYGTSGAKIGNAYLKGAVSAAAVVVLRTNPAGQQSLARLEKTQGKGKALTGLAHTLARAVYLMLKRDTAFDRPRCLQSEERAERVSLTPNWTRMG